MRAWHRRVAGGLVAAMGLAFIVVVLVDRLFTVGPAFERVSDAFRPSMNATAIARLQQDVNGLRAAAKEFSTTGTEKLAAAFGMTPNRFDGYVTATQPAVAEGMKATPAITAQFDGLLRTLRGEQGRFASADAIPTSRIPATTVPWAMLVGGIVLLGVGIAMMVHPIQAWPILAMVVGAAMVIVPLALNLPSKASAADTMNAHLTKVYTATMVDQATRSLDMLGNMGTQLQTEMLPVVASQLGVSSTDLQGYLSTNLPALATEMKAMPGAMARFTGLVNAFSRARADFDAIKDVAFVPVVWTMILGGAVALLAGTWGLVAASRRQPMVTVPEAEHLRAA